VARQVNTFAKGLDGPGNYKRTPDWDEAWWSQGIKVSIGNTNKDFDIVFNQNILK